MPDIKVILPSKTKAITEEGNSGVYEIENLYPGYGYTLGNSLRRIILSSLPGAAVTSVKIDGISHEFSTMAGLKEDIIALLLNIKKLRFRVVGDEPQKATLKVTGPAKVTAKDLTLPGQVEIVNGDEYLGELTEKTATLDIEFTIEKGIGYAPKEVLHKDKVDIGVIALDASFTTIRRVNYEVENMRVGNRTDFNRLRISIETDGIMTPREALESSIEIMITQLKAIVGFQEEELTPEMPASAATQETTEEADDADPSRLKLEELDLSARTFNALEKAGIRTVGGLSRKAADDLLSLDGLGEKGVTEIRDALTRLGLALKE